MGFLVWFLELDQSNTICRSLCLVLCSVICLQVCFFFSYRFEKWFKNMTLFLSFSSSRCQKVAHDTVSSLSSLPTVYFSIDMYVCICYCDLIY